MSNNLHNVRTCKTWAGYTATQIVASAKLVTCAAGSVEITPVLPSLNGISHNTCSGYLLILTEDDTLLIESVVGAHCQMPLTPADADVMRNLTERAEAQMLASQKAE